LDHQVNSGRSLSATKHQEVFGLAQKVFVLRPRFGACFQQYVHIASVGNGDRDMLANQQLGCDSNSGCDCAPVVCLIEEVPAMPTPKTPPQKKCLAAQSSSSITSLGQCEEHARGVDLGWQTPEE
jgi:hypothetical protein